MSTLRSFRAPLTAAWLVVHLLVMSGPAIVAFTSGASPSEIVCTCAHGADHGSCPMHRTRTGSSGCQWQGAQDDLAGALLSLLGPVVLPVSSDVAIVETPSPRLIAYTSPLPSGWLVPPEPPPPRL